MNFNTLGKLETDPECIHYLGLKLRPSARLKQEKKLVKLERPQSARVMARSHSFWKGPSRHCKKLCLRAWPKDTSTHQSVKQHLLSKDAAACIAATSRHINRHERHERHERQERHGNCSSFPGSGSSRLSFEFVNHLYPKSKQSTAFSESGNRQNERERKSIFCPQPPSSHHLNQLGSAGKYGRKVLYSCGRCCLQGSLEFKN